MSDTKTGAARTIIKEERQTATGIDKKNERQNGQWSQ
jgi:hypothetical protein